jgi:hypothetical protein
MWKSWLFSVVDMHIAEVKYWLKRCRIRLQVVIFLYQLFTYLYTHFKVLTWPLLYVLGPIQNRSGKHFKLGAEQSGCMCKYKWVWLGNFATVKIDSPSTCPFQGIHQGQTWKAIGDRLLKPCYLNRDNHNRKIRTRKQRTDVGKYSFVNSIIKSWNQLPASLLVSFPCKQNMFRKRVKNVRSYK